MAVCKDLECSQGLVGISSVLRVAVSKMLHCGPLRDRGRVVVVCEKRKKFLFLFPSSRCKEDARSACRAGKKQLVSGIFREMPWSCCRAADHAQGSVWGLHPGGVGVKPKLSLR